MAGWKLVIYDASKGATKNTPYFPPPDQNKKKAKTRPTDKTRQSQPAGLLIFASDMVF